MIRYRVQLIYNNTVLHVLAESVGRAYHTLRQSGISALSVLHIEEATRE